MQISSINRLARKAVSYFGVSALFVLTAATAQVGVAGDTGIDNSGNYPRERGWCMVNTVGDERVACLKDAGAAQSEKRRGTLDNHGANFSANAMRRCDVFAGEDRAACVARVLGHGDTSGSVQGGGTLKEIETLVVPPGQRSVIILPKKP